jgi:glycosyltransferase involved in cell wall biosynthesis
LFNTDIFGTEPKKENIKDRILKSDIIFISDMFAEDYVGGAELTTEAFYENSDSLKVCKIKANQINPEIIQHGIMKHWVFFNYASLDVNLIPVIIANLNYSIVEYDYKFCKYRSIEKHKEAEGVDCDCHNQQNGKLISAFMYGADNLMWMSEKQRDIYFSKFSFLKDKNNIVVSSAFNKNTIDNLRNARESKKKRNEKAMILGSNSWIKGVEDCKKYCEEKGIEYELFWNVPYEDLLEKMAEYSHFVFLPKGGDTCPRIIIEAKLAGMNLHLNNNVQHTNENWWGSIEDVENYIINHPVQTFWKTINKTVNRIPTLSGYTTTKDCISQQYPYNQAIQSILGFCDQVVVVDGGSTDGTWEALVELSKADDRIIIDQKKRDWSHPRFAVFDGLQKAYARSLCTGDWCWQMDSDEIVHEKDYPKIKNLMRDVPKSMHLLALPVIEYWGSEEKVRVDVNPWKWRLSRNLKHITHGIPGQLRRKDDNEELFAAQGTDGCDYIDVQSHELIPCMHFYNQEIHNIRIAAMSGNLEALEAYENWYNNLVENLPGVHHYSWINLERKIKTYKNYWSKHWQSLYDIKQDDTPENNMFFDKSWEDVSNQEIEEMAKELKEKMGGWIFHSKVDFNKPTPHISIEREQPEIMK